MSTLDLIDAIVSETPVEAEKQFNSLMADRIADRLETYRKDVAMSFFNPQEEQQEDNATE